jgi:UDP-N-acetylmuramoyl-tripeptide--D-alanyl-D-alanine ligase
MAVMSFALERIASATGGRIEVPAPALVRGLCLDSRRVTPGCLFAAIKGQKVDGHAFVRQAVEKGAAAVLAEEPVDVPEGGGVVQVGSVEEALKALGSHVRSGYKGCVVGVVGSCGKTTTKDFTAAVLSRLGTVHATSGNRNNLLGLPETLMAADMDARFWVLEMGISRPDEMAALAPIARPSAVIFTGIEPVHMEFFPSLEAIRDEKCKVFESLEKGGAAFLNGDDPLLADIALPEGSHRTTFGTGRSCHVRIRAESVTGPAGSRFEMAYGGKKAMGVLHVSGVHNLRNFAAAAAAGTFYGLSLREACEAASGLKPVEHRGEAFLLRKDVLLFDDSYNANPAAVGLVLEGIGTWHRRPLAVLGEMLELGEASDRHHRAIGKHAVRAGVEGLLAVGGSGAAALAEAFAASGRPCLHVPRWEDGADWFEAMIRSGDGILVKGSRGIGLDGFVHRLLERRGR